MLRVDCGDQSDLFDVPADQRAGHHGGDGVLVMPLRVVHDVGSVVADVDAAGHEAGNLNRLPRVCTTRLATISA